MSLPATKPPSRSSRTDEKFSSDAIASQADLHALYGGVVPEIASRKHIEAIYGLADQALEQAQLTRGDIDAVAVTYAPGLIGAVLVGVNFAKLAALGLGVPLVPVHHIRGHIAANYLAYPELEPPFLCLVVSGGHSMIVDVQDYTKFRILGSTRDDAAASALTRWRACSACPTRAARARPHGTDRRRGEISAAAHEAQRQSAGFFVLRVEDRRTEPHPSA